MVDISNQIAQVDEIEVEKLLSAVLQRYAVLFPDYEMMTVAVQKGSDRSEQLDRMIAALEGLKSASQT